MKKYRTHFAHLGERSSISRLSQRSASIQPRKDRPESWVRLNTKLQPPIPRRPHPAHTHKHTFESQFKKRVPPKRNTLPHLHTPTNIHNHAHNPHPPNAIPTPPKKSSHHVLSAVSDNRDVIDLLSVSVPESKRGGLLIRMLQLRRPPGRTFENVRC